MKPGDIIQIKVTAIPLPEFPAAITEITPTGIEVMSTILAPFADLLKGRENPGHFTWEEIEGVAVTCPAETGVKRETGVNPGERLVIQLRDGAREATVIAGFDGIVAGKTDSGEWVAGGQIYWSRPAKAAA